MTQKLLQQGKTKRGHNIPKKSWDCQVSTKISDLLVTAKYTKKTYEIHTPFCNFFHAKSWTGKGEIKYVKSYLSSPWDASRDSFFRYVRQDINE